MDPVQQEQVNVGENRRVSKKTLLSHLWTYNLYYEGQALQLRHREEEGELIVEGLLNVSWGLRRPIRLQMQDEKERIRLPSLSRSQKSKCSVETPTITVTPSDSPPKQHRGDEAEAESESTHLLRTRSDVGGRRSGGRLIRRHRCSINGHYYNHKTAVFTPAYGSVTNVRINTTMTTSQVLRVLLKKFKIENSPDDFALFLIHTSGERVHLKNTDHPLAVRILEGPCEQVSRIFLMDKDLVEEVTYDVAQYIKFEMPVLQSFIDKLKEEEDREVSKLKNRYMYMRCMIEKTMQCCSQSSACI